MNEVLPKSSLSRFLLAGRALFAEAKQTQYSTKNYGQFSFNNSTIVATLPKSCHDQSL